MAANVNIPLLSVTAALVGLTINLAVILELVQYPVIVVPVLDEIL